MSSKAILIIDEPPTCMDCPCIRRDIYECITGYQCRVTMKSYDFKKDKWISERRADDCPLRIMQE